MHVWTQRVAVNESAVCGGGGGGGGTVKTTFPERYSFVHIFKDKLSSNRPKTFDKLTQ